MAKINQTITQFPTAPNSATDSAPVFNTKANAFVGHQSGVYVGEVNTWATEANALRDEVNGIVATIPVGSINDYLIGTDKVWSSTKVNAELLKKVSIGIGQSWQNLTTSRSSNTTYTNNTGKPIQIKITGTRQAVVGYIIFSLVVNGLTSVNTAVSSAGVYAYTTQTAIIPDGGTYLVTTTSDVGNNLTADLYAWHELR